MFERIQAMPVVAEMLPEEPSPGSPASGDPLVEAVAPYTYARSLLLGAVAQLLVAATTARKAEHARLGTHILLLRPALVATAKAAWTAEAPERGSACGGRLCCSPRTADRVPAR